MIHRIDVHEALVQQLLVADIDALGDIVYGQ